MRAIVRTCVRAWVRMSQCVYICSWVYACMRMCVYVCKCVYVHASVCACVWSGPLSMCWFQATVLTSSQASPYMPGRCQHCVALRLALHLLPQAVCTHLHLPGRTVPHIMCTVWLLVWGIQNLPEDRCPVGLYLQFFSTHWFYPGFWTRLISSWSRERHDTFPELRINKSRWLLENFLSTQ
jgi:hypothetical protein